MRPSAQSCRQSVRTPRSDAKGLPSNRHGAPRAGGHLVACWSGKQGIAGLPIVRASITTHTELYVLERQPLSGGAD